MSSIDPTSGVVIRRMQAHDLDAVIAIAAALPTAPEWSRSAYEAAITLTEIEGPANGLRRLAWVAVLEGSVAGLAIAVLIAGTVELESIAVASVAQGRGLGLALMQSLIEESKLAGALELVLEVRGSNLAAAHLYAKLGLVEVGRRRSYYTHPIEDAVLLRLSLVHES
jgi:ribosomal-protein-alanine N-acetyltransferase